MSLQPSNATQLASFVTESGRKQAPYLHLDPATTALSVVLPPLDGPWSVSTDGGKPKEFAAGEQRVFVCIARPFQSIEVTAGEQRFSFPGITAAHPFIVLDSLHRVVPLADGLSPDDYTFIVPPGTQINGQEATCAVAWPGWVKAEVQVKPGGAAGAAASVQLPYAPEIIIPVREAAEVRWFIGVQRLPNARGVDAEPVFTKSPSVVITAAPKGEYSPEYTGELVYIAPDGQREVVHEDTLSLGIQEIFPADLYEDPWVGRYEYVVYRCGQEIASRYFTMIEGLHMRARNEGPRGTEFRSVDALGAFSHFSYSLAGHPDKPLRFPTGLRDLGGEATREECIGSEAGYEALFTVVPAAITSRYKYTGQEPVQTSAKVTIHAGQLDEHTHFSVHAPEDLPLAKFVSIDKRAKIKDLVKVGGTTAASRTLTMSNAQLKDALGKQSSIELYLLWSTLSYADYLAELSDFARSEHLTQDAERRQMEYEATAAKDLIYASLATVVKSPFATDWADMLGESRAWAWPLGEPLQPPHQVEGGVVPENIPRPVILDVRALDASTDLATPAGPAASSIIIGGTAELPALPADHATLLEHYLALRNLCKRSRNAGFAEYIGQLMAALRADAPATFTALPTALRWPITFETGMFLAALPIHTVDLPCGDSRTQPLKLQQAMDRAPSDDPRIQALRECLRNDLSIHRLYTIRELRAVANQLVPVILGLDPDTSVQHTLIALQACAEAATGYKAAHQLPFVSYVFSYVSRACAAGICADTTVETLLHQHAADLARVAAFAPLLFDFDMVTAASLLVSRETTHFSE